jgi:hypothetical protein
MTRRATWMRRVLGSTRPCGPIGFKLNHPALLAMVGPVLGEKPPSSEVALAAPIGPPTRTNESTLLLIDTVSKETPTLHPPARLESVLKSL